MAAHCWSLLARASQELHGAWVSEGGGTSRGRTEQALFPPTCGTEDFRSRVSWIRLPSPPSIINWFRYISTKLNKVILTYPPAVPKVLPTGKKNSVPPEQVVPGRPVVVPAQAAHPTLRRACHPDVNEPLIGANILTTLILLFGQTCSLGGTVSSRKLTPSQRRRAPANLKLKI